MLSYKILNEQNKDDDVKILEQFYGNSWQHILERITPQPDGHVITIQYEGQKFRVFRTDWSRQVFKVL